MSTIEKRLYNRYRSALYYLEQLKDENRIDELASDKLKEYLTSIYNSSRTNILVNEYFLYSNKMYKETFQSLYKQLKDLYSESIKEYYVR